MNTIAPLYTDRRDQVLLGETPTLMQPRFGSLPDDLLLIVDLHSHGAVIVTQFILIFELVSCHVNYCF